MGPWGSNLSRSSRTSRGTIEGLTGYTRALLSPLAEHMAAQLEMTVSGLLRSWAHPTTEFC